MNIEIRPLCPQEVPNLFKLIEENAEESNLNIEVTTSPERLQQDAFAPNPCFKALLAWEQTQAVGFILWFPMYSAWKGQKTLYLEDLFVCPFWRHQGIATQLFCAVEKIALKHDASLAWECDRDRLELRRFFTRMGAIDRAHKISFYMEKQDMWQHLQDSHL